MRTRWSLLPAILAILASGAIVPTVANAAQAYPTVPDAPTSGQVMTLSPDGNTMFYTSSKPATWNQLMKRTTTGVEEVAAFYPMWGIPAQIDNGSNPDSVTASRDGRYLLFRAAADYPQKAMWVLQDNHTQTVFPLHSGMVPAGVDMGRNLHFSIAEAGNTIVGSSTKESGSDVVWVHTINQGTGLPQAGRTVSSETICNVAPSDLVKFEDIVPHPENPRYFTDIGDLIDPGDMIKFEEVIGCKLAVTVSAGTDRAPQISADGTKVAWTANRPFINPRLPIPGTDRCFNSSIVAIHDLTTGNVRDIAQQGDYVPSSGLCVNGFDVYPSVTSRMWTLSPDFTKFAASGDVAHPYFRERLVMDSVGAQILETAGYSIRSRGNILITDDGLTATVQTGTTASSVTACGTGVAVGCTTVVAPPANGVNRPVANDQMALTGDGAYLYYLRAFDDLGSFDKTVARVGVKAATQPRPGVVTNLVGKAHTPTANAATLTWAPPGGNATGVTGYTVTVSPAVPAGSIPTNPGISGTYDTTGKLVAVKTAAWTNNVTFTGLNPDNYKFAVRTLNDSGVSMPTDISVDHRVNKPASVDNLKGLPHFPVANAATLTWAPPGGNATGITSYTVTVSPAVPAGSIPTNPGISGTYNSAGDLVAVKTAAWTNNVTFTGLNPNWYTFTVAATNVHGTGTATTSKIGISPGIAVTNLVGKAHTPTANAATLTWAPPGGNATGITGYTVTVSPAVPAGSIPTNPGISGTYDTTGKLTSVTTASWTNNVTFTGLPTGTYTFTVAAKGVAGLSPTQAMNITL